jgi:hypothetical protein
MNSSHPGGRAPTLSARSNFSTLLAFGCLFLLLPPAAAGQDPAPEIRAAAEGEVQELVLADGSVLFGRVVDAGDPLIFQLLSGSELRVPHAQVRGLRLARGEVVEGEFWNEDPNRTRLFFGPTARSLRGGEGYLAVYEIIMPFLAFGITDNLLISGGTPLIFGEGGSRPFWVAPKVTFLNTGETQAAVGVLAMAVEDESAGILYGVLSRGSPNRALSVGIGYGYVNDEIADSPAVMLGGELRVARRVKLLTENYFFPGGEGLVSVGPRFFGERLSADLGLVMPVGSDDTFVFPLINFVWNF